MRMKRWGHSWHWGLCLLVWNFAGAEAEVVTVRPACHYQTWDGWGTSLSWWAHNVGPWSETNRTKLADLLFSADQGLGLNVIRYNIGGQDDPTHDHMRFGGDIPSFRPLEEQPYDWTADGYQREMLNMAIARGANRLEAFSCSPPYWMTVSGCSAGAEDAAKDNLHPDKYPAYADYLTEILRHFRDEWNITFDTLAPFNEPLSHYWEAGKQHQGCHYEVDTQQRILRLLAHALEAKGLSTRLSAADETCTEHCVLSFGSYHDEVKALVSQINTHTYNYSWDRRGPRYLADQYGKRLHMSEICFASRVGEEGHNHEAVDGALELAASITRDLREMQPQAWVFWQPVENENYCVWWKFNYGLIHADVMDGTEAWAFTRKYYGFAQYTRFIRPGQQMIGVDADDTVAFVDRQKQRLVLVAYNPDHQPRSRWYRLDTFTSVGEEAEAYRTSPTESLARQTPVRITEGGMAVTEPGRSITTYVVSNAAYHGPAIPPMIKLNDTATGGEGNRIEYLGDWQYTNAQAGAFVSDNHWSPRAGDRCRIHFHGTGITLYAATGPNLGIAEVTLDGSTGQRIDYYAEARKDQTPVYTSPVLEPGPHCLELRVTGEHHPASTAAHVAMDRVDIEPVGRSRAPSAGFVYEDDFASDPTLNPGLVALPGGQDSRFGYNVDDQALWVQSRGGICLQLVGVRFKAGRSYTVTMEVEPSRADFEAGFFPAAPTAIDDPIPLGASGRIRLPARDSHAAFTHSWTFHPIRDASNPFLLIRAAGTAADDARLVVNRIRLEEDKTSAQAPLRILCVGDSITAGYTTGTHWNVPFAFGYRSGLFRRLLEQDIPCQFVGTSPQPYNLAYNIVPPDTLPGKIIGPDLRRFGQDHHQGWAGAGISGGIQSNVVAWIEQEDPDVILLMIGINAIPWDTPDLDPVVQTAELEVLVKTILDRCTADDRATHLIVAQITPRTSASRTIEAYNRYIREELVPGLAAAGAPISTVDQYANFLDEGGQLDPSCFAQANHPSNLGYARMAETWWQGLVAAGLVTGSGSESFQAHPDE